MNKNDVGILVVDDELIVRESLSKWFLEEGYRVDTAENAACALKKLQTNHWNIMLVDIKMPGMDGIELLHRVKETNKQIAVVIITAFASVDTAVKSLKDGAYDYVTKPIDPDYLDHLIEKSFRSRNCSRRINVSKMRLPSLPVEMRSLATHLRFSRLMSLYKPLPRRTRR